MSLARLRRWLPTSLAHVSAPNRVRRRTLGGLTQLEDRAAPNSAPVAYPEAYTLSEDSTLTVPARGVLANDTDPDGVASGVGPFALVTNQFANTVTWLNLSGTPTVVGTVPVGNQPNALAVTQDGQRALVGNVSDGTVTVLSLSGALPAVVGTVSVGGFPIGIGLSPDGTRAIVANGGGRSFSVLDVTPSVPVVTATVALPADVSGNPYDAAFTADGQRALVATSGTLVLVYDMTTATPTEVPAGRITAGSFPIALGTDPGYTRAVAPSIGSNTATAINLTASPPTAAGTVAVGSNPGAKPDISAGGLAVVPNADSGTVTVLDVTGTPTVVATRAVGPDPRGAGIADRSNVALIANRGGNSISRLDLGTMTAQTPIPGVNSPSRIAVVEEPGDVLRAVLVAGPAHGSLILNADGSFTYAPHPNFHGTDSFTYKVNDGQADSNVTAVTLTVTPVNAPPVAGTLAPRPQLAADLTISTATSGTDRAATAFDGNRYLAVWNQSTSGVLGRFVKRDGTFDGSPFVISSGTGFRPTVAFNGRHYLVAWEGPVGGDYRARVVGTAGQLLGTELFVVSSSYGNAGVDVASDGTGFLLVWADGRSFSTNNGDIFGQRVAVSAAGVPTFDGANFRVSPAAGHQQYPSVAFGGGNYLVTWANDPTINASQYDVYGALVSPAGTVLTPSGIAICTAPNIQGSNGPGVAFDGANFLVAFTDLRSNATETFGMRVSPAGALLDGPAATGGFRIALGSSEPAVASNGNGWVVAFTNNSRARMTYVTAAGGVSDTTGFNMSQGFAGSQFNVDLAGDGTNFLGTWSLLGGSWTKFGQLIAMVPVDQLVTTAEDTPVSVPLVATDADGDPLTYTVVSAPAHGALSGTAPNLTFTPPPNFSGTVTFTYKANDGQADSNVVTVRITVTPVNDAPVANDDAYSLNEDGVLGVAAPGVRANDTDPEGSALTASLVSGPADGVLAFSSNGSFTYTPAANFFGTDTFTYRVSDGGLNSAPATVTVTVHPVNDAPGFTKGADQTVGEDVGPQAVAGWATNVAAGPANEAGQALRFLVSVSHPALFAVLPAVSAGGALTYTPAPDANGSATVTVRLADNGGTANGGQDTSAAQAFTITVTAVNDKPIARDDAATTDEDTPVAVHVLANDSTGPATAADEAAQTLAIVAVTQPLHGTVVVHDNGTPGNPADDYLVYTPAPDYSGPDSFGYTVRDSGAPPEEATASGTVAIRPVNDWPTAAGGTAATPEDTGVTVDLRPLAADAETADADLTYAVVTGPSSGTLAATATNGVYVYTPAANFHGTVTFTYTVTDTGDPAGSGTGALTSTAAAVSVAVTPVNDAPVASGDAYTVNEDTPLTVPAPGALGNDGDVDGDLLHAVLVSGPAHGSLGLAPDGSITYVPATNFHGSDSFTYKANDGATDSNVVTVAITVSSVNDAPVAGGDGVTTAEDTAVTVNVLANDTDADGDALAVTAVTNGAHGTVSVNGNGTVTYTPAANFHGDDTFTYAVADGHGGTTTSTVTVRVTPVNDAPVATADAATTAEDTAVTVAVRGNDSDVDGDTLVVAAMTQGSHGSVTHDGSTVTYTPAANFHGTDSFTYTVADGNGGFAVATVSVTVTPVNDAPVTNGQSVTTAEDTSVAGTVTAADVDGDALTFRVVADPAHGTLTSFDPATGAFTYVPAGNYHGPDSFTVAASDGTVERAAATVAVTVTPVNDAPVATADAFSVAEDAVLTVAPPGLLGNDSDVDGNALTAVLVGGPAHGGLTLNADGLFTYTPHANFHGFDSFTYKASDGTADGNVVTVVITVAPVNDAPVAVPDAAETAEDAAVVVAVLANDSDVDGGPPAVSAVTQGAHGAVTVNANGTVTYTPAANFFGADTFTYSVADGNGGTATATVAVTVTSVNDNPLAVNDTAATAEDTALAVAVLANDSDADGGTVTVASVTRPAHGAAVLNADGTVTYTPAANYHGADSFTYTIADGQGGTATGTVTITVTPVNDAPTAAANTYTVNEDSGLTVAAPGVLGKDADVDGDTLSAVLVTGPANGSLTLNADGSFAYTPAANFHGIDTFTYRATDGLADSAAVTVTITVTPANDAPVAVGNMYTTDAGSALTVAAPGVLQNDTDADGDVLAAVLASGPAHGSLALSADGSFTYTPAVGFSGTDSFTYKANDGTTNSSTVTVTITVNAAGAGATLIPDPCDPTKTALLVRGTAGNDHIVLTPGNEAGEVTVKLNGAVLGTFAPTGRVLAFGLAGDDDIQTTGSISFPVWLRGGGGDDRLRGGDGDDVLLGEVGDDLLVGGGGRDLLIGGEEADRIVGNANDDVLIAGFTDLDASDAGLCAVMAEWMSARDYADRVRNLQGGPDAGADGANGTTFLNPGTVHDEGVEDVLTGSSGMDWFHFNVDGDGGRRDQVTDMAKFESLFADDIDFIYVDPT